MQTYSNPTRFNIAPTALHRQAPASVTRDLLMTVCPEDTICISAVQYGKTLLDRVTLRGYRSLGEILTAAGHLLGDVDGIVTVSIRNRDNGWTITRSLRVRRPSMTMPFAGMRALA